MIDFKELRCGDIIHKRTKTFIVDQTNLLTIARNPLAYSPVVLTEQILLKCGFKNKKDGVFVFWSKDVGLFMIIKSNDGYRYWTGSGTLGTDIYNFHQLQNLYFALTGQELNTSGL